MKKLLFVAVLMCALVGCGTQEQPVFETIGQVDCQKPELPAPGMIEVYLPEEAAAQTMSDDGVEVYSWDNYEVRMQTQPAGDILATMQQLTGIQADELTIMKQEKGDLTLYQTVWSSTDEDGLLCGRAMVADDGNYYYCVSLLNPESVNADELYAKMMGSFQINSGNSIK